MAKVRLGVVLPIPPPASVEIDGLRRACGDRAFERIECHLTLVPPVNVAVERVDEVVDSLRQRASAARPLDLILGPVTSFLPDQPVLYLGVGGEIEGVRRLREEVFTGPLSRTVSWPFLPHVTIADGAPGERIAAAMVALADYRVEVTLERLHLLQEGEGRRWLPIADLSIGTAVIVGRGGLPVELNVSAMMDPEAARFFATNWDRHLQASYGDVVRRQQPIVIVARREGGVVGVASGTMDNEASLDRLVVGPNARHQGIGAHLLARFEHLAAERGCRRMVLIAQAGSDAQAFYAARGWTVDLTLPGWRLDRDFVRMVRATP